MTIKNARLLVALVGVLTACTAAATTYTDNFTGTTANLQWTALNDACLTAGNGTGSIPTCSSMTWMNGQSYTIPADQTTAGQGALLLTPPRNNQTGAILSAFNFTMSQGLQVTFTTYTYGGDSGGLAKDGADGIVFFLTDGTQAAPSTAGAEGGSMGYGCSNDNGVYDGVAYGYLGLGIDEYGNFLNSGDNGSVGVYNSNDPSGTTANGTNSYYNANGETIAPGTGPQYQPQRIGLRGAGNTNWKWLTQNGDSTYYTGSSNESKVQAACKSGKYVSSHTTTTSGSGKSVTTWNYSPITYNYNAIPGGYAVLPNSEPIANESAQTLHPASGQPVPTPITYKLSISSGGLLNFSYSYNDGAFQPVLANFNITSDNGPLPASLRFGFSAGTGGSNNVHEITCFEAAPLQANSSAASNTVTGKVTGNTQFFLASYSTDDWWGSLVAEPLVIGSDGTLSVGTVANWDAKCVLTGGPCDSMGVSSTGVPTTSITAQAPANRTLLTSTAIGAGDGVALQWSSLSTAEQNALNTATSNTNDNVTGQNRVAWLQGYRTDEQLAPGCTPNPTSAPFCDLRARTYVLGDIINSSPTFVGAPTPDQSPDTFFDQIDGSADPDPENQTGAQKYSAFVASNTTRLNVVYVGSNDGFVHGFEAGNYDGTGSFNTATNDGKETVGYMPYDVLMNKITNLASPLYVHDYLVDATPAAGDVFYANAWHTWLVGGVGSSGKEIYALDITNPSSMSASKVIGDWDNTTLTHLGDTVGTPVIARMHNGDWAIIFGSGLVPSGTSSPPTEGVYIGLIDPSSGSVTFQFLDTGAAPTGLGGAAGGIAYVSSVDLDGDDIADYLYAGDTDGRVWRFDVTSTNTSNWKVSSYGGGSASPLFQATNAAGNPQPITTSITALAVQTGTVTRDMLYFGTGQETQPTTSQGVQYAVGTSAATPSSTAQTFYGIWDWNMNAWNLLSSTKYAALNSATFGRANLLVQTLQSPSGATRRYLSTTNVVCWSGDTSDAGCTTYNQFGWLFDLPDPGQSTGQWANEGEQIIYNPTFIEGAVVVNTAIPPEISASQCNAGNQTGWTMAFDPATGGGFTQGYFPDAGGGSSSGSATSSGTKSNGIGTSTLLQYGGSNYLLTHKADNTAVITPINPPSSNNPSRVSWRELVNP